MISSLFRVTDVLAGRGHELVVLSDIAEPGTTAAGVHWVHEPPAGRFDALVLNRGVGDGYPLIEARRRVLWTHDLPHAGFVPDKRTLRAIDQVVFMSRYAEAVWRCFYPDIGRSLCIPNGVDRDIFKPDPSKDLKYLIYASAPNRGLKRLPLIFDALKAKLPGRDLKLRAYSDLARLHPNEVRDEQQDGFALDYQACEAVGIERLEPVPQPALGRELGRAGLMLLPTDYPEICSNIVLQSLACGTPIVTTGGIGSATEWIRHGVNGWLTRYQPVDYMVHSVEMIRAAEAILGDAARQQRMIKAAARTPLLSWEEVGKRWERLLNR